MNKKIIKDFKEKLEKEKENLEKELEGFAKKDQKAKGNWQTKYPDFDGSATGGQKLEEEADEVEEFMNLLPIESNLELRLRDINLALEKIKKGKYGECENCKKTIGAARLNVFPAARTCQKCKE